MTNQQQIPDEFLPVPLETLTKYQNRFCYDPYMVYLFPDMKQRFARANIEFNKAFKDAIVTVTTADGNRYFIGDN